MPIIIYKNQPRYLWVTEPRAGISFLVYPLLIRIAFPVEVFPHIAGCAILEGAGALLISCAAAAGHGVFPAADSAEDSHICDIAGHFYAALRTFAAK